MVAAIFIFIPVVSRAELSGHVDVGVETNDDGDSARVDSHDIRRLKEVRHVEQDLEDEGDGQNNQEELDVDQDSLDNEDSTSTTTSNFEHAENVHNKKDLLDFAKTKLHENEEADDFKLSSTTIEASYPTHAKLLGLIPMSLLTHVVVNSDGSVDAKFPWYAFLFSTEKATLESNLQQGVQTQITSTSSSPKISTPKQAKLLDVILAILRSNFSSSN